MHDSLLAAGQLLSTWLPATGQGLNENPHENRGVFVVNLCPSLHAAACLSHARFHVIFDESCKLWLPLWSRFTQSCVGVVSCCSSCQGSETAIA